jgi:DNA mismatch endonuclease (patch repair protein)
MAAALVPGPSARSANMRANRRRDTKPELVLRSLLHARGLRFRVDFPLRVDGYPRPIRPDVVFTRAMCVVEWNGCWWHGCDDPACGDGLRRSVRNAEYWLPKIRGNRERDARKAAALEASGWKVLSFWGHDDPVRAADLIAEVVAERRVAR